MYIKRELKGENHVTGLEGPCMKVPPVNYVLLYKRVLYDIIFLTLNLNVSKLFNVASVQIG
jgi:hypothetical protein